MMVGPTNGAELGVIASIIDGDEVRITCTGPLQYWREFKLGMSRGSAMGGKEKQMGTAGSLLSQLVTNDSWFLSQVRCHIYRLQDM